MDKIQDGQHSHGPSLLNTPVKRNCFFCLKDKLCVLLNLDDHQLGILRKNQDPTMQKVVDHFAKMHFAACAECKADPIAQAEAITSYLKSQYILEKAGQ